MRSLLYEKRYHPAFAVTRLVCPSEVSVLPPPLPIVSSMVVSQYTPVMIYAVLAPSHMTYTDYDVITGHILVRKALGRRASEGRLLASHPEVPQLELAGLEVTPNTFY